MTKVGYKQLNDFQVKKKDKDKHALKIRIANVNSTENILDTETMDTQYR